MTLKARAPKVRVTLTPRETQILAMRGEGFTNREICRILVISEGTIKRHMNSIFNILDATSCAHAICKAIQRGILVIGPSK